jgi:hypothetical protein
MNRYFIEHCQESILVVIIDKFNLDGEIFKINDEYYVEVDYNEIKNNIDYINRWAYLIAWEE